MLGLAWRWLNITVHVVGGVGLGILFGMLLSVLIAW